MEYDSIEVPAVGEVRARPGTATHELAGAAKYWHDKCVNSRRDGFIGGFAFGGFLVVGVEVAYHLIRSLF